MAGLDDAVRALRASGSKGLLTLDFARWPVAMRIKIDKRRLLNPVGRAVKNAVKKRLRRGQQVGGAALPKPKDGGRPLRRSGDLINHIDWDPRTLAVRPLGSRDDLGPSLRARRESLLWVLIHKLKIDPMGVDAELIRGIEAAVKKALIREMKRPGFGLLAEMRRVKGRR